MAAITQNTNNLQDIERKQTKPGSSQLKLLWNSIDETWEPVHLICKNDQMEIAKYTFANKKTNCQLIEVGQKPQVACQLI